MCDDAQKTAEEALLNFFDLMHGWEKRCKERFGMFERDEMKYAVVKEELVAEYGSICDRCCVPGQGIRRSFTFADPPDYDRDCEPIVRTAEGAAGTVEVFTQQMEDFEERFMHRLAKEDGTRAVARHRSSGRTTATAGHGSGRGTIHR